MNVSKSVSPRLEGVQGCESKHVTL